MNKRKWGRESVQGLREITSELVNLQAQLEKFQGQLPSQETKELVATMLRKSRELRKYLGELQIGHDIQLQIISQEKPKVTIKKDGTKITQLPQQAGADINHLRPINFRGLGPTSAASRRKNKK